MRFSISRIFPSLLLILSFVIVTVFTVLVNTSFGLKILVQYAQPALLENGLHIDPDKIHGRLSELTIDELFYQEEISIRAKNLQIIWDPLSIWSKQIFIHTGSADALEITLGDETRKDVREAHQRMIDQIEFKMPTTHLSTAHVQSFKLNHFNQTTLFETDHIVSEMTLTRNEIYFNHMQLQWHGFDTKLLGSISIADSSDIDLRGKLSRQTSVGSLALNLILTLQDSLLKVGGEGKLTLGQTQIPLAYELIEKDKQLELLAWDTKNPKAPQFILAAAFFSSSAWNAQLDIRSLDLRPVFSTRSNPLDIQLIASGDAQTQNLQADFRTQKGGHLSTILKRAQQDGQWKTQVDHLNLQYGSEQWSLGPAPELSESVNLYSLKNLCLNNGLSQVCAEAFYEEDTGKWSTEIISSHFENKTFNAALMPFILGGFSSFQLKATGEPQKTTADFKLGSNNTLLQLDDDQVTFNQADIQASYDNGLAKINMNIATEKKDVGHAEITMTPQKSSSSALEGIIDLDFKDLNPINLYLANFYEIRGAIQAHVKLGGTVAQPIYDGHLDTEGFQARIPQLGIGLNQINLNISGDRKQQFHIKGSAQSSTGNPLILEGSLILSTQDFASKFELKGDHIQLLDLPPAKTVGSLDLIFTQSKAQSLLKGSIHLHEGQFDGRMLKRRFGGNTVDIMIVNAPANESTASTESPTQYQIQVILDDQVYFSGFDISTRIAGEVQIESRPQRGSMATGQLKLMNGAYDTYNKHFTIENGLILYSQSELSNPNLDVTARYDLQNANFSEQGFEKLEITIRVVGSLHKPKLLLSSRPTLSQEDILSYLILGTPLSQVGGNSAPLSQAALVFALKGGSQTVLNNIRQKLGLTQLSLGEITSNQSALNTDHLNDGSLQDNTAIFLGKSLSPNLYVSYGIGLFNAQQIFRTRLKLGRRWQFITESSTTGNAADFIYIIERGD